MNLTPDLEDALTELVNIGVGRAASMLNAIIQSHIRLQIPVVRTIRLRELQKEEEKLGRGPLSSVLMGFKGPFSGRAALVFSSDSASKLVALVTDDEADPADLDAVTSGTLIEVGNIVMNGVMGSIGNVLDLHLSYSVPTYVKDNIEDLLITSESDLDATVLLAQARFTIEQLQIDGDIILLFETGSFDSLLAAIESLMDPDSGAQA